MRKVFFTIFLIFILSVSSFSFETITFKSTDGLPVTADVYMEHNKSAPFILLFHRARWSRGEYRDIALKLNQIGFNCMAVDLRSGKDVNEVPNETAKRAVQTGLENNYLAAFADMESSLKYADNKLAEGKLLIWGSSYSAALCFVLADTHSTDVDGLLAFAPGEYFANLGKSRTFVRDHARKVRCPVFITSAKSEQKNWQDIYDAVPVKRKSFFVPETEGVHGSEALWKSTKEHKYYWQAVENFLRPFLKK
ncbi:MAG: alpha/beta hydrolase family protein [Calditrichaceae bacterium]